MSLTLTLEEAASLLKVHPETLRELALKGKVPGVKVGRAWVFITGDLVAWLRTQYKDRTPADKPASMPRQWASTQREYEKALGLKPKK